MSEVEEPELSGPPTGDMPPDQFRTVGREAVDWVAEYLESVDDYPVLARVSPGDVRGALPALPPEDGEDFDAILRDFRDVIVPGITHWNHPAFHGYFAVTGSGPGILGELLSSALNVNAMVWRSSPAGTELEELSTDWLRFLLGLPESFDGVINDTASVSSLVALAAAREANLPEAFADGLHAAPRARIYASEEAHSSIYKAGITLGLGRNGVRAIPSDDQYRMRLDLLREAIEEDVAAGIRPIAIVATLGTTSTTSVDPVGDIADVAEEFGAWLHVDSAYAGAAAMLPELRPLFSGWERADSVVLNPHKWLFTPVDCSVLYSRRPEMIRAAFSLTPEYLRTPELGKAKNLMDYGVALGRRFRALKLWFVMRYFGARGLRERIRNHCRLAAHFADRIDGETGWERAAPVPFSTVVFRWVGAGAADLDAMNMAILEEANATGRVFLSHTRLRDRTFLRLSVGNLKTGPEHMARTWDILSEARRAVQERTAATSPTS